MRSLILAFLQSTQAVDLRTRFKQFIVDFNREYVEGTEEYDERFAIFKTNVMTIDSVNRDENSTFTLRVNEFADQSMKEFSKGRFGVNVPEHPLRRNGSYKGKHTYSGNSLPESVDWTKRGAVTPPKDQGQCGSCWSFSTTGSIEGAWAVKTGNLVSLSEQQFVDCDPVDHGCNGGLMDFAFEFAEKHGLCAESDYRYHAEQGDVCLENKCKPILPLGSIVGFKDVDHSDEALMEAVSQQPVSVAIEADAPAFQFYNDGVLTGSCGHQLDHGVLLVGYGTWHDGTKYWKIKNSWGPGWGKNGFVLIQRGPDDSPDTEGKCGILKQPSYPLVSDVALPNSDTSTSSETIRVKAGEGNQFLKGVVNGFSSISDDSLENPLPERCIVDIEKGFVAVAKALIDVHEARTQDDIRRAVSELASALLLYLPTIEKDCAPQQDKISDIRAALEAFQSPSATTVSHGMILLNNISISSFLNQAHVSASTRDFEGCGRALARMLQSARKDAYSAPPCISGSMLARVSSPSGKVVAACVPKCGAGASCPRTSLATASPQCALKSPTGDAFCALLCSKSSECERNELCVDMGGAGLCGVKVSVENSGLDVSLGDEADYDLIV